MEKEDLPRLVSLEHYRRAPRVEHHFDPPDERVAVHSTTTSDVLSISNFCIEHDNAQRHAVRVNGVFQEGGWEHSEIMDWCNHYKAPLPNHFAYPTTAETAGRAIPRPPLAPEGINDYAQSLFPPFAATDDGNIGEIDNDYVLTLLRAARTRPLTLEETRYLEQCIFSGPSTIDNEQEAGKQAGSEH
jgi:hypothetical protein